MALRKIIVGWDGGEPSRDALRLASVLARTSEAVLVLAHAYRHEGHQGGVDSRLALRARALDRLAAAEKTLAYGTRATTVAVECRSVVQGLHDLAESEAADLLVLGATTKGALELHAIGSVAERLLRAAPCAVAVAPRGYAEELKPGLHVIGVAYDGSAESAHAVEAAGELALAAGAAIQLIGVADPAPSANAGLTGMYASPADVDGHYRESLLHDLERVADTLAAELRAQIVLADGDPARELIERAGVLSLLVMGSRGYGPLRRALLGSVSAPVLRAAPCPVLVVPRGAGELATQPAAEAG